METVFKGKLTKRAGVLVKTGDARLSTNHSMAYLPKKYREIRMPPLQRLELSGLKSDGIAINWVVPRKNISSQINISGMMNGLFFMSKIKKWSKTESKKGELLWKERSEQSLVQEWIHV